MLLLLQQKRRFLNVLVVIAKLVTAIQRTSEQLALLEGGQYFFILTKTEKYGAYK